MESVFLIGNGFDIHYKFPTWYKDFLHVTSLLIQSDLSKLKTVGDVLSNEELQEDDAFIKKCYAEHEEAYHRTELNYEKINMLVGILKKNMWFKYFLDTFDKDLGWIDVEKEVALVLSCFENAFQPVGDAMEFDMGREYDFTNYKLWIVTNYFDFFIDHERTKAANWDDFMQFVKEEYIMEYPYGSGNRYVDKKKVISKLYDELVDLATGLKLYIECFVENTFNSIQKTKINKKIGFFEYPGTTVTCNYTNTFEWAYPQSRVLHIHGNVKEEIVLGVNPDEKDDIKSVDTSFIEFKKYFQRSFYGTDSDYIRWISKVKNNKEQYCLFTMGHSLDVTDKDVIVDLFTSAEEIVILYHDDEAKKSYIRNLVEIFGHEEFENMKKYQGLKFLSTLNGEHYAVAKMLEKIKVFPIENITDDEITII